MVESDPSVLTGEDWLFWNVTISAFAAMGIRDVEEVSDLGYTSTVMLPDDRQSALWSNISLK